MTFKELLTQMKGAFELEGGNYWLVDKYSGNSHKNFHFIPCLSLYTAPLHRTLREKGIKNANVFYNKKIIIIMSNGTQ